MQHSENIFGGQIRLAAVNPENCPMARDFYAVLQV
jgi:hypothetical protein